MAKNTSERAAIRLVRDGIKSKYEYAECCEVCGTVEDLELHHPNTVSLLFFDWCASRGFDHRNASKEEIMNIREDFYKDYYFELVEDVMTLCNTHHKSLHKVYGSQPPLSTAPKQREWVKRIRDRSTGKESQPTGEGFSRFIPKTFTSFSDIL